MVSSKIPRVLLIGAGRFGIRHLETLQHLAKQNILALAGVVVRTGYSREQLQKKYALTIHTELSDEVLTTADAVDIVTPVNTHFELISRCLPKVHVLVEKPLAATLEDAHRVRSMAKRSAHTLMVGHIFRFHPVVTRLKKLLGEMGGQPISVEGVFTNPLSSDNGRDVEMEMLHMYDIVDYLFQKEVLAKQVEGSARMRHITLNYSGGMTALFSLGWTGSDKKRSLDLLFAHHRIICDLQNQKISFFENGYYLETIDCASDTSPLEKELRTFVEAICSHGLEYPDADVGVRIVEEALMIGNTGYI